MEKIDNDPKVGAKSNKIIPKNNPKTVPTARNRSREKIKKKEPTVPPWRPSAGKPEDMYFEKFNRIMNQKRYQITYSNVQLTNKETELKMTSGQRKGGLDPLHPAPN